MHDADVADPRWLAPARARLPRAPEAAALCIWLGLIITAIIWGGDLNDSGAPIGLHAPPLVGYWEPDVTPWLIGTLAAGTTLIFLAPRAALALSWTPMLWASTAAAAVWAVALSALRGPDAILEPVRWPTEYLSEVGHVGNQFTFLSNFTERISEYSVHVRGHPPGMILLLDGMDRVGLSGPGWAAALMIVGGAAAVPAALIAMREVAGEANARSAAPFLILAPAAVWIATSADAFFAGVGAWSVTLLVLASGRGGRRRDLLALAGGLGFGVCLMLSYGLVLLAAIPLVILVARRSWRVLVLAVAGGLAVILAFAAAGFWWVDGLQATREQYFAGIASDRPFDFFFLNNLAAFGLVIGPATVIALTRLRDRNAWLLVGGGLAVVALAELSGMSKGEVERIWLPFAPWILLAGCAFGIKARSAPPWLAAQVLTGIVIVATVHTHW